MDPPAGATRIIWIRHGEVDPRWAGRVYGDLDIPLSKAGARRSEALAAALASEALEAVVSSGLARSRHAAEAIAAAHGLAVTVERDFREVDRGRWRGLAWEEVEAQFPGGPARFLADPEYGEHGGESLAALSARVLGALERLVARHPAGTVAVVGHLWPIRCVAASVLGMPLSRVDRLALEPGATCGTAHAPGRASLLFWNRGSDAGGGDVSPPGSGPGRASGA